MSHTTDKSEKTESSDEEEVADDFKDYSQLELQQVELPKTAKNPVVTDELNDFLRQQLTDLKTENESLKDNLQTQSKTLQENETTIAALRTKLKNLTPLSVYSQQSDLIPAQQVAQSKIVELSKKLREKSSEIEVYKTKCTKLEANYQNLKEVFKKEAESSVPKEKPAEDPDMMKVLQDKLNSVSNKWVEERNQSTKLKNDLKLANKWLQQEVGEKFETLLLLNNNQTNWRGRAQIIQDLQQKNLQLKEKLKNFTSEKNASGESTTNLQVNRTEKKIDLLEKENLELKSNYEEIKRKYEAGKARCKVLESECNLYKAKLTKLNESHENDQQLIADLNTKLMCKQSEESDEIKTKEQTIKKLQNEVEELKVDLGQQKCNLDHKSSLLAEKEEEILALNRKIRESRPPSSYSKHNTENPDARTISRLEAERIRLLELTEIQNKRLQEERNAHFKTQNQLKTERQKGAKLEANFLRVELEQKSQPSYSSKSFQNLRKIDTSTEDKLELAEENIKALVTRLEIEIFERQKDIKEFASILKNYENHKF